MRCSQPASLPAPGCSPRVLCRPRVWLSRAAATVGLRASIRRAEGGAPSSQLMRCDASSRPRSPAEPKTAGWSNAQNLSVFFAWTLSPIARSALAAAIPERDGAPDSPRLLGGVDHGHGHGSAHAMSLHSAKTGESGHGQCGSMTKLRAWSRRFRSELIGLGGSHAACGASQRPAQHSPIQHKIALSAPLIN